MKNRHLCTWPRHLTALLCLILILSFTRTALAGPTAFPVIFKDSGGHDIKVEKAPQRVVSLMPAVTEMIFRIGAGDAVKGITYHTNFPPEASEKAIIGGYFIPSVEAVDKLNPDVVFISGMHEKIRSKIEAPGRIVIQLEPNSISDIYRHLELLGRIFQREENAAGLIKEIKDQLDLVAKKIAKIPPEKRKRVMRLMGRDKVMTPGDDSFQIEFIRLAGGIPPVTKKPWPVVPMTLEQWREYNPQFVYGCGDDHVVEDSILNQPGWNEVDAVKNHRIRYFPCALTCRASTHVGYFINWLASTIYAEEFSKQENLVLKDKVVGEKKIEGVDLDYLESVRVLDSIIMDCDNKTLVIDFKQPMRIVSTLEGQRSDITRVGNHYSSPPAWGLNHHLGLGELQDLTYKVIGADRKQASFLFTGANMNNLAVKKAQYRDLEVYALITAGVEGNAMRASVDEGLFYEPGTINMIIMANMKMSPRAMTRAIISATEAKTAVMQDLDIRSSTQPAEYQATGTGTDSIIVVEGTGTPLDSSGGHTKLGELISKAVYAGVKEAIYKQNCLTQNRHIFRRLKKRNFSLFTMIMKSPCPDLKDRHALMERVQALLMDPKHASFLEYAFAISDARSRGRIKDLSLFELSCKKTSEEIAGRPIAETFDFTSSVPDLPPATRMAVNAIINGARYQAP